MTRTTVTAQLVVRVAGVTQLALGMLFWSGFARGLVPVHVIIGLILVLGLWTLAVLGLRGGAHRGLVTIAALWGFVVPVLGMTQEQLLTGGLHWIIQILHLLVGVAAIGMAEGLAGQIKQARATPTAA